MPEEKIFASGNGIDPEDFERLDGSVERVPGRCLYASSYDRGLEILYRVWPDVRRAHPHAKLHVFYGWDTFDARTAGYWLPELEAWKAHMLALKCHSRA